MKQKYVSINLAALQSETFVLQSLKTVAKSHSRLLFGTYFLLHMFSYFAVNKACHYTFISVEQRRGATHTDELCVVRGLLCVCHVVFGNVRSAYVLQVSYLPLTSVLLKLYVYCYCYYLEYYYLFCQYKYCKPFNKTNTQFSLKTVVILRMM